MSISKVYRADEVKNALQENKRDALNASGITISGTAKELAPVYEGRLRSSIAWAIDGGEPQYPPDLPEYASDDKSGRDTNNGVKAPKNTVIVGTNVEYARYQHEGVILRGPRKGQDLEYKMRKAEKKFLEKGIRRNIDKIKRDIRRALEGKLEKQ